jgi:hypothetical protein
MMMDASYGIIFGSRINEGMHQTMMERTLAME